MTTDRVRSVILEAVDCLRLRKCRPDRESIAVFVMRKLGCSMSEIYSEVEHVVDQGDLIKVEYKGSISYRSPKNFDVKNSPLLTKHSKILNSSKTTRYINSGINELLSTFPNYNQDGVPYEELKKTLAGFDPERFAESGIKVIFEREESTGNILVAQSDDPVYPLRIFPKDIKVPKGMKQTSFVEEPTETAERKRKRRPKRDDIDEWNKNSEQTENAETLTITENNDNSNGHPTTAPVEPEIQDTNPAALAAIIKNKTHQISSIGLKVISEKGRKRRIEIEKTQGKTNQDKPTVKKKDEVDKAKPHNESNGKARQVGTPPASSTQVENLSTPTNSAPKSKKRKAVSSKKPPKLETPVQSDNESTDSQLFMNLSPLRFTYAAKRKTSYDNYSESFKRKIPKKSEAEPEVQNSVSVVVLSANGSLEKCTHCQKDIKHDKNSDVVSCATCNSKTHLNCLNCSEERTKRFKLSSFSNEPRLEWECTSCQRCGICKNVLKSLDVVIDNSTEKNEQKYLLCDKCDKGYHISCIEKVPKKSQSIWNCKECNKTNTKADAQGVAKNSELQVKSGSKSKKRTKKVVKKKKVIKTKKSSNEDLKVTAVDQKPAEITEISNPTCSEAPNANVCDTDLVNDEDVPDISSWTPSQVQTYFSEKGLHDAAASLREQEIDGMSLLLLRRADIIFGLNLRLGPALKIYRLVCQLQQHSPVLKNKTEVGGTCVSQNSECPSSNS